MVDKIEDLERPIKIEDTSKALVELLANFHKDRNTRINSAAELMMILKWRLLESMGIKMAGTIADTYEKLKWSADGGRSRDQAVEVLKKSSDPKYFVGGPQGEEKE